MTEEKAFYFCQYVESVSQFLNDNVIKGDGETWGMTVDGRFLPAHPKQLMEDRKPMSMMMGVTSAEEAEFGMESLTYRKVLLNVPGVY